MNLRELDLTLGKIKAGICHEHPEFDPNKYYLCKIGKRYFAGRFCRVWFGWSFDGWYAPLQYDKPGTNSSNWKRIWEINES